MNDTNKMPFNWKPTIKIMVCKMKQQKEEAYRGWEWGHRNRSNNPVLYNLNQYKSTPHVSPGMNFIKSTFVESIQKGDACSHVCVTYVRKPFSYII